MIAADLPRSVVWDTFSSLLGEQLGAGMSRRTFAWVTDPTLVMKLETGSAYQNVIEWQTWNDLMHTPAAQHLAPCRWISACGTALLMERTSPLRVEEAPKRMPAWLGDFKYTNYGLIGKGKKRRVVCHDYGTNLLISHGVSKRMRTAKWWDA